MWCICVYLLSGGVIFYGHVLQQRLADKSLTAAAELEAGVDVRHKRGHCEQGLAGEHCVEMLRCAVARQVEADRAAVFVRGVFKDIRLGIPAVDALSAAVELLRDGVARAAGGVLNVGKERAVRLELPGSSGRVTKKRKSKSAPLCETICVKSARSVPSGSKS